MAGVEVTIYEISDVTTATERAQLFLVYSYLLDKSYNKVIQQVTKQKV